MNFLIESADRQTLHLLPQDVGEFGLTDAVTSERLPLLLAENNMQESFLAEYTAQLATRGMVDCDLLIIEGSSSIKEELSELYERAPKVKVDGTDLGADIGYYERLERSEDEHILAALGNYVKLLDYDGYCRFGCAPIPFDVNERNMPHASIVPPLPILDS